MSNYRQQFCELRPEEITYNKAAGTLNIRMNSFPVANPKLAFIEALEEFPVTTTYWTTNNNTKIHNDVRIGDDVEIGCNCTIGGSGFGYEWVDNEYVRIPHLGDVLIEDKVTIHNGVNIDRSVTGSTIIGKGSAIDSNVHIGHNAKIGKNVLIAAGAIIGGSAVIGDNVFIGCNAVIRQKLKVGAGAVIGSGSVVIHNVPDGQVWAGNPAKQLNQTNNANSAANIQSV